jgi:hypothetical protein
LENLTTEEVIIRKTREEKTQKFAIKLSTYVSKPAGNPIVTETTSKTSDSSERSKYPASSS